MDELQEILNEFVDEATEVLGNVMTDLMDLEGSFDDEVINRVYRAFHSVKGNAGMLGLERLSAFAHAAEDVLSLVRERRLEPDKDLVTLLLRAVDTMIGTLEDMRCGQGDVRDGGDIKEQLAAIVQKFGGPKAKKRPPAVVECPMIESDSTPPKKEVRPPHDLPHDLPEDTSLNLRAKVKCEAQDDQRMPQAAESSVLAPPKKKEPATSAAARAHSVDRNGRFPRGASRTQEAPLRILVVEDDFSARQLLVNFLAQFGTCHVAKDGLEAIHAFIQGHETDQTYDLICMDIKMPVMDGLIAARTMREIERGKGLEGTEAEAIIVITSSVEDPVAVIKACYECGANYYFLKPLDIAQVRRQLFKMGLTALLEG